GSAAWSSAWSSRTPRSISRSSASCPQTACSCSQRPSCHRNAYWRHSDTVDIRIPLVSDAVMPRLNRAEQVERNRGLVVEAARRVFLEHGYAGATLETIADAAGFSKGVVYSQFESKADLFLT